MDRIRFGLDLSLRNISMVSIAVKLWDSQDVKNRIQLFFTQLDEGCIDEDWFETSNLVAQYTNSMDLPASLSVLLKEKILLIGEKIFGWIHFVTHKLKLDLIFTEKIYFSLGEVDEVKIFDLYWRDLMAADSFKCQSCYFKHSPVFSLACIYGCEIFVNEHKNEMLEELSQTYPQIREGDEIYNIMSVSICMTSGRSILGNVPPPQQMFELCLEEGFSKAARFYWEKLEKVEKTSNLTNFAKKCLLQYYGNFLAEKSFENLLFLINLMEEEEMYLFFKNYADEIILLSPKIWQYQELIILFLKCDWDIESSRLKEMAICLIWLILHMSYLKCPVINQLVFQIMRKAWGYMPVSHKLQFVEHLYKNDLCWFLNLNWAILNLVLNDPSLKEVYCDTRFNQFIKKGLVKFLEKGKFDVLNKIIEKGFHLLPEPKEFLKENFPDFFLDLMDTDETFGLVDSFLDWSTESEAERAKLKNKIDTISVYRHLTGPLLSWYEELGDKFVKWRLETDVEIENFKEGMKNYS